MARPVVSILLLLISLLTIVNAPTYHLWLLAIGATEFPLIFGGITLMVIFSGIWLKKYRLVGTVIALAALALFLWPVMRAYRVASVIKQEMTVALRANQFPKRAPFSFWRMFCITGDIPFKTVNYVNYGDITLSLDYYKSQKSGDRPCVLVIHGGSWNLGDSRQLPELNSYLARAGYQVASINYRKAPQYHSPAPVQDVSAALNYLRLHHKALNIDTNNIVLLGRSAGAQVALLAAYIIPHKGIKGVINYYGPADMVWGYSAPASKWVMDSRAVMEAYLGGKYAVIPQNYAASSPINFVTGTSVPTLSIHGAHDVLVAYDHSRRLHERLQQNGVRNYWLKLPWATHGFDFNFTGPGGQLSTFAVEAFLASVTSP